MKSKKPRIDLDPGAPDSNAVESVVGELMAEIADMECTPTPFRVKRELVDTLTGGTALGRVDNIDRGSERALAARYRTRGGSCSHRLAA